MGGSIGGGSDSQLIKVTLDLNDPTDHWLAILINLERANSHMVDGTYTKNGFLEGVETSDRKASYRFKKESFDALERMRSPCLSLEDALNRVEPLKEDMEIEAEYIKSSIWYYLSRMRNFFEANLYKWTEMASTWRDIEILAMADELDPEMIDRFNEIVKIWTSKESIGS
jgi:hypothetical protein